MILFWLSNYYRVFNDTWIHHTTFMTFVFVVNVTKTFVWGNNRLVQKKSLLVSIVFVTMSRWPSLTWWKKKKKGLFLWSFFTWEWLYGRVGFTHYLLKINSFWSQNGSRYHNGRNFLRQKNVMVTYRSVRESDDLSTTEKIQYYSLSGN